jgi:hypothetical protein
VARPRHPDLRRKGRQDVCRPHAALINGHRASSPGPRLHIICHFPAPSTSFLSWFVFVVKYNVGLGCRSWTSGASVNSSAQTYPRFGLQPGHQSYCGRHVPGWAMNVSDWPAAGSTGCGLTTARGHSSATRPRGTWCVQRIFDVAHFSHQEPQSTRHSSAVYSSRGHGICTVPCAQI